MTLIRAFATPDCNWVTPSIDAIKQRRGPKQGLFNQVVVARVELVKLVVFSAIEFGVHLTSGALKFAAVVLLLPFRGFISGWACLDAFLHLERAAKLAIAVLVSPLGIVRPEWTVSMYQRFSLVKESPGLLSRAKELVFGVAVAVTLIWFRVQLKQGFGLFVKTPASQLIDGSTLIRIVHAGAFILFGLGVFAREHVAEKTLHKRIAAKDSDDKIDAMASRFPLLPQKRAGEREPTFAYANTERA